MAKAIDVSGVGDIIYGERARVQRVVAPIGLVETSDGFNIVKAYQMYYDGIGPFDRGMVDRVRNFARGELRGVGSRGDTGLGFMILSDGSLNISMWGEGDVINTNACVLDFPMNGKLEANEMNIGEDGPFCAWELHIAGHEARAWAKYLRSKGEDSDKIAYLRDAFQGKI